MLRHTAIQTSPARAGPVGSGRPGWLRIRLFGRPDAMNIPPYQIWYVVYCGRATTGIVTRWACRGSVATETQMAITRGAARKLIGGGDGLALVGRAKITQGGVLSPRGRSPAGCHPQLAVPRTSILPATTTPTKVQGWRRG